MIERELAEGVLKPLPLVQGGIRRPTFYLYSNKDKPLGPATRILIELIKPTMPNRSSPARAESPIQENVPCSNVYFSLPVPC